MDLDVLDWGCPGLGTLASVEAERMAESYDRTNVDQSFLVSSVLCHSVLIESRREQVVAFIVGPFAPGLLSYIPFLIFVFAFLVTFLNQYLSIGLQFLRLWNHIFSFIVTCGPQIVISILPQVIYALVLDVTRSIYYNALVYIVILLLMGELHCNLVEVCRLDLVGGGRLFLLKLVFVSF